MATAQRLHFRRHVRFYGAGLVGTLIWLVLARLHQPLSVSFAGIAFFGIYLGSSVRKVLRITPARIREQAAWPDEGIAVIVLLTLLAAGLSFASLFSFLGEPDVPRPLHLAVSLLTIPLGWTTLHTIMAFHYAHLFYSPRPSGRDAGGLIFPGTEEPGAWDFLYYSFVVGMTAQVSDVQVAGEGMRRATLAHGIVSFFFNTVIVALAVNIAVGR